MTKNDSLLNPSAVKLWGSFIQPEDKILITGATGWFGRTALALCEELPNQIMLVGSRETKISALKHEKDFKVSKFDENTILKFEPTIFIDAAFLTRGHSEVMSLKNYIRQNQAMMQRSLRIAMLPSINRFLSFSSGAAVDFRRNPNASSKVDPYGYLKDEWEKAVQGLKFERSELSSVIIRPWSVSGIFVRNPREYAFSNIISQVSSNKIYISANNLVFRRYTSVEDLLAVSLAAGSKLSEQVQVIDSGGELVEIGELAQTIKKLLNPSAIISRNLALQPEENHYASDNSNWSMHCENFTFEPQNLSEQIIAISHHYLNYWKN